MTPEQILAAAQADPSIHFVNGIALAGRGFTQNQAYLDSVNGAASFVNGQVNRRLQSQGLAPITWDQYVNQGFRLGNDYGQAIWGDRNQYVPDDQYTAGREYYGIDSQTFRPTPSPAPTVPAPTAPAPVAPPAPSTNPFGPGSAPPSNYVPPAPGPAAPPPSGPIFTPPPAPGGGNNGGTGGNTGGLFGTNPTNWAGNPWQLGGSFSGTYAPPFIARGIDGWDANNPRAQNPGAAPISGPGATPYVPPPPPAPPSGMTNPAPTPNQDIWAGSGSSGDTGGDSSGDGGAGDSKSGGLFGQSAFQPRNFVDYYGGGIRMPHNNLFQQYTQSMMMGAPVNPTFNWAQPRAQNAPALNFAPMTRGGLFGGNS